MSTTVQHLWAHIQQSTDALGSIANLPFFRAHQPELSAADIQSVTDLLHMAWSTEYALRATAELRDESFLRDALHWSLPQAAHCINFTLRAFMLTLGVRTNDAKTLKREAGRMIVKNAFPRPVSFYAAGAYGDFSVHRLPLSGYDSPPFLPNDEVLAQKHLAVALRANRKAFAQKTRLAVQDNPNTAIRSQQTGKPLGQWKAEHWQQITWRLGYTTVFSLLADLRMEQGSPELAAYAATITDYRAFHEALGGVVSFLSGVHEAYVFKSIGPIGYGNILNQLPSHLQKSFPAERLNEYLSSISQTA